MTLRAKSKNKWVVLDDCEDDETQITEVMEIPERGCIVRCTDTSAEDADHPTLAVVPGAKLSDFIKGTPREEKDDED